MSRQLEKRAEDREHSRRTRLVAALEYELVETLSQLGAELCGFSIMYEQFNCLLTLKADFNGKRHVAFLASDTMMNCIIKSSAGAATNSLKWMPDKYHEQQT